MTRLIDIMDSDRPSTTLQDVIEKLKQLEAFFVEGRDRRAIFVTVYREMTQRINHATQAKDKAHFEDVDWVKQMVVIFGNLYFDALRKYVQGADLPKAWRLAFNTAVSDKGVVILDMILGMNAHINRDLPYTVFEMRDTLEDPVDRDRCKRDFFKINNVLFDAIDPIQDRICKMYSPSIGLLDKLLDPLDEEVTRFSFERARRSAWVDGISLINTKAEDEREATERSIDDDAHALGHLVSITIQNIPIGVDLLRFSERLHDWTSILKTQ